MPIDAPLTGGYSPGAGGVFAIDGDFSYCDPCSLPEISYPLSGDSIFSDRDVFLFDDGAGVYIPTPLGSPGNIQPWSSNQVAAILTQEFVVAQKYFQPMRLNTAYNPAWADGWNGSFSDSNNVYPIQNLSDFFLVREGELQDVGAGLVRIRRTWATLPHTRNEIEQFTYSFPGFADTVTGAVRQRVPQTVLSRLQYDYFVFDNWGVTGGAVFPAGPILNSTTGLYPNGLIIPAQYYYSGEPASVQQNLFTDNLDDGDPTDTPPVLATEPSFTAYISLMRGSSTSNGLPGEIVSEASTMTRWMGNIFERRTRFVLAQ